MKLQGTERERKIDCGHSMTTKVVLPHVPQGLHGVGQQAVYVLQRVLDELLAQGRIYLERPGQGVKVQERSESTEIH